MPIANHPTTPAEMIISSEMPESGWFRLGFDSESADFIPRSEIPGFRTDGRRKLEQGSCLLIIEVTGCIVVQAEEDVPNEARSWKFRTGNQALEMKPWGCFDNHRVSV